MNSLNLPARAACALVLSLSFSACRQETPSSAPVPETAAPAATTAAPAAVSAQGELKTVLRGTLDNRLNVEMTLLRQGNKLTGSYFYERVGAANSAEKNIALEGESAPDGNVTLSETSFSDAKGERQTGTFKGVLDRVTADGEAAWRFQGTWTDAQGKKSLPFALTERRFALGGFKLSEKQLAEKSKEQRYEIEVALPQLTGGDAARAAKFNQAVAAVFNKEIEAFKGEVVTLRKDEAEAEKEAAKEAAQAAEKEAAKGTAAPKEKEAAPEAPFEMPPYSFNGSFEVIHASPAFVSILLSYSTYMGGAHPSHVTAAFNYDLQRGVPVQLAELFAPSADYLKVIAGYSIRELKKLSTTSDVESGAAAKPENYGSWNITPLGLLVTFDPYQVGAYAVGSHEVLVPYATLKPVAKADGLLAPFLK